MREIKFRAWDGKEKIMWIDIHLTDVDSDDGSNGFLVDRIRNGKLEESFLFGNYSDEHIVWMQYTGLHDKNGKEIYEGDILSFEVFAYKTQGIVKYIENGFWLTNEIGDRYVPDLEYSEVIGNIYENPELVSKLNKEKK